MGVVYGLSVHKLPESNSGDHALRVKVHIRDMDRDAHKRSAILRFNPKGIEIFSLD